MVYLAINTCSHLNKWHYKTIRTEHKNAMSCSRWWDTNLDDWDGDQHPANYNTIQQDGMVHVWWCELQCKWQCHWCVVHDAMEWHDDTWCDQFMHIAYVLMQFNSLELMATHITNSTLATRTAKWIDSNKRAQKLILIREH